MKQYIPEYDFDSNKNGFVKISNPLIESNISWDEFFMRHAYLASMKSKDCRTHIGAVLVKNNIIISEGYNAFARGVWDLKSRYEDRETKLKYVCHAEFNSCINCARNGISTLGSICYTQGLSCLNCTKTLIQSGISEIVTHYQWPKMGNWEKEQEISTIMFEEAGVNIRVFDKVLGLEGFGDGNIIKV